MCDAGNKSANSYRRRAHLLKTWTVASWPLCLVYLDALLSTFSQVHCACLAVAVRLTRQINRKTSRRACRHVPYKKSEREHNVPILFDVVQRTEYNLAGRRITSFKMLLVDCFDVVERGMNGIWHGMGKRPMDPVLDSRKPQTLLLPNQIRQPR